VEAQREEASGLDNLLHGRYGDWTYRVVARVLCSRCNNEVARGSDLGIYADDRRYHHPFVPGLVLEVIRYDAEGIARIAGARAAGTLFSFERDKRFPADRFDVAFPEAKTSGALPPSIPCYCPNHGEQLVRLTDVLTAAHRGRTDGKTCTIHVHAERRR
jgi:hypothetical protein